MTPDFQVQWTVRIFEEGEHVATLVGTQEHCAQVVDQWPELRAQFLRRPRRDKPDWDNPHHLNVRNSNVFDLRNIRACGWKRFMQHPWFFSLRPDEIKHRWRTRILKISVANGNDPEATLSPVPRGRMPRRGRLLRIIDESARARAVGKEYVFSATRGYEVRS